MQDLTIEDDEELNGLAQLLYDVDRDSFDEWISEVGETVTWLGDEGYSFEEVMYEGFLVARKCIQRNLTCAWRITIKIDPDNCAGWVYDRFNGQFRWLVPFARKDLVSGLKDRLRKHRLRILVLTGQYLDLENVNLH